MERNIIIKTNVTIREAMKLLSQTPENCLLVVDDQGQLIGTLTDGDI